MSGLTPAPIGAVSSASSERDAARYDANKPVAEIEQDIARTRAELSVTLDAMERRLGPRHLLEKGVDMLSNSVDGDLRRLGDFVRKNPLSLALIGAGIGWLLLANGGGGRTADKAARSARQGIGRGVSDVAERADEMARGLVDRAGAMASVATGRVKAMVGGAQEPYETGTAGGHAYARPKIENVFEDRTAGYGAEAKRVLGGAAAAVAERSRDAARNLRAAGDRAGESAGEQMARTRDRVSEIIDEHPLAVGVLGLLAGAVLGLALPAKRLAGDSLGETRDRPVDDARDPGRQAIDRAEQAAGAAAAAATEAARQQMSDGESDAAPDDARP